MYEDFYNLRGKPFKLSPDPDFFYASRGHSRAMAYLEFGIDQGEGFIVITGEVGAGKTTLVSNLLQRLNHERLVAARLVSTQFEAEDMLRSVVRAFNLQAAGSKSDLLETLESYLRSCHSAGKRCLLIVDEAQNLADTAVEELRMLSNFETETGSLLQSFLIGQPEFRETLQSPAMRQLRQRVIASYHLAAMARDETRDYIEHRLSRVGWQHQPAFSEAAYDALHQYAGGVPRQINTICDRLLLMAFLDERQWIDDELVSAVIEELQGDLNNGADVTNTGTSTQPASQVGSPSATAVSDFGDAAVERLEGRLDRLERQIIQNATALRRILDVLRRRL